MVRAKVFGVVGVDRMFALKRILPMLTANPAYAQALSQAARAYASLEHPRIARLAELTVSGGQTFTATELVTGLDVGRLVAECRVSGAPLPPGGALGLLIGAARAVGYAHGRGLLHLGLCPQNLVVSVDGDLKVTDFGILAACLPERPAEDPRLAHRVAYLAPEQLVGEPVSAATDVFALGALGIEMVTGQPAFRGETPLDVQHAVLSGRVNDPSLPGPIVRVLQRCLARAPFERFPDARALADALEATLRTSPVRGTRVEVAERVNEVLEHLASLHEGGLSGVVSLPSAQPAPPPVPPRPPTSLGPEVIDTPLSLPDQDRLETAEFLRDDALEDEDDDAGPGIGALLDEPLLDSPSAAVARPMASAPSRSQRVTDAPMIAATLRGFSSGATPRPMPPSSSGPVPAPMGNGTSGPLRTPPSLAAAARPAPLAPPSPGAAKAPPSVPLGAPPVPPVGAPPVPMAGKAPPSVPLGAPPVPPVGAPPVPMAGKAPPSVPLGAPPVPPVGAPPVPMAGKAPPLGPPPKSGPLPSITAAAAAPLGTAAPLAPVEQPVALPSDALIAADLGPPPQGAVVAGAPQTASGAARAAGAFASVVPSRPAGQVESGRVGPPERKSTPQLSELRGAGSDAVPTSPDGEVTTARVGALVSAWDEAMETFEQPTRVNEALSASLLAQTHRTGPAPRLDLAELLAPAEPPERLPSAAGSFEAMPSSSRPAGGGGGSGFPSDPDPWAPVASVSTVFPESVPKRPSGLDVTDGVPAGAVPLGSVEVSRELDGSAAPRPWPAPESQVRTPALEIPRMPPSRPSQPPPLLGAAALQAGVVRQSQPSVMPPPYPQAPPPVGSLLGAPFGEPFAPEQASSQGSSLRWLWWLLGLVIVAGSAAGAYAVFFGGFSRSRGTLAQLDGGVAVATAPVDGGAAHDAPLADGGVAVAASPPADAGATSSGAPGPADAGAAAEPAAPPVARTEGDGLVIESNPAGARVYIDGADQGVTPLRLPGPADRHSAVLFLAGYELGTLELEKTGTFKVELKEITPLGGPAGIKVRCKLKERYYITIDGKPTGSLCPSERLEVERGEHVVETYDLVTEARRQFRVVVKETSRSTRVRVD